MSPTETVMLHPGRHFQVRSSLACTCCAIALLAAGTAFAQDLSQPADDPAATAAASPAHSSPATRSMVGPGQMPHVPKVLSRPDGWPGGNPDVKSGADNHVLSSILPNPGGPLEPIAIPPTKNDAKAVGKSGVIQTGFEETLPSGAAGAGQPAGMQSLDNARVVARVGPEVVLEGDLLTPTALAWLDKVSGGLTPEQIRELKTQICRQVIKQHVESLIVYVDACRTIPEDRIPEIEKKVNEAFDQQQLPRLVSDAGVANALEYDQLLRSRGQSLDRIRKTFFERALAQQWIQQKVVNDGEIPHAEMIAWYQNHLAEYDYPAKARFEQLTVKITATRPRGQAWNMLAAMGNEVMKGKPFADVARSRSEGPTAATGGSYEWTTKGSLVSKVVDEAVFTMPVGQLSAILDDGSALHILRVTERNDAGRTPFIEAQVGIRNQLQDERRKREMEEYLTTVRDRTPVWTIFDADTDGGPTQAGAQAGTQTASQPRTTR
jgi:parvulin-like peptidyl-prolyl isomerase